MELYKKVLKKKKEEHPVDKVTKGVKDIADWMSAPARAEKAFLVEDQETFEDAKADYSSTLAEALKRKRMKRDGQR